IWTVGKATFNLPNGEIFTISWTLDPYDSDENDFDFSLTSDTYYLDGADSPSVSGNTYTFNITVNVQ
ncbi:MAG: hypothetical protein R6W90_10430, partial [Ignavibacteriaceae bacterium]